jgi:hypothetical protein
MEKLDETKQQRESFMICISEERNELEAYFLMGQWKESHPINRNLPWFPLEFGTILRSFHDWWGLLSEEYNPEAPEEGYGSWPKLGVEIHLRQYIRCWPPLTAKSAAALPLKNEVR